VFHLSFFWRVIPITLNPLSLFLVLLPAEVPSFTRRRTRTHIATEHRNTKEQMGRKAKQQKSDTSAPAGSVNGGASGKERHADSQLWTALKHGDEEALLNLLFDKIDDAGSGEMRRVQKPTARKAVSQPNAKKVMPLSYAVSEGLDRGVVELLLRAGAAVNKRDETPEQLTALHSACWNEDGEAMDALLRAGADPRVVDADGRTPLHILAGSNAVNLVLRLLDSVDTTVAESENKTHEDGSDAKGDNAAAVWSAAVKMDPIVLLRVADKVQGSTVLHLALGESTYNFGVAQALCDYLEKVRDSRMETPDAVAQLVSARSTLTGDSPLHALVAAANAEDAVVEALARRLLALGADPVARNAEGQSILEVAIRTRPGCSTKAATHLYTTLLAPLLANGEEGSGCAFLREKNKDGQVLIHVALSAGNAAAVKALCSAVPTAEAKAVLGDPVTDDGITVVELLATTAGAGASDMADALIAAQAVARDVYESLRRSHEALQAERRETEDKEEAKEKTEDDDDEDNMEEEVVAGHSVELSGLKRRPGNATGGSGGGAGGISRVQQARKARAATAAQRKQQPFGHRPGHEGRAGGGLFGDGELSTPVKVVGVLLLLSIFVSAYTMFFALEGRTLQGP
jgi:ankyrin repeat protein